MYRISKNSLSVVYQNTQHCETDTEFIFLITSVIVEAVGFAFHFITFDRGSQESLFLPEN